MTAYELSREESDDIGFYLPELLYIVSKFNNRFSWNGDTKEIADTAIARQLLDM